MYKFMGYYIIRIKWQYSYAYAALTFKYGIPLLLHMDDSILYGTKPTHSYILFPRRSVLTRKITAVLSQILTVSRYNNASVTILSDADIAVRLLLADEPVIPDTLPDMLHITTDIAAILNKKVTHKP